jgi:hypothetical protein
LFLIIVNVLGHPKGVGGLTSNFLGGGGMDVFWNDPLLKAVAKKLFYITTLQNVIIYFSTIISSILIIIYKHYHRRNVKNEFSFNGCFLLAKV